MNEMWKCKEQSSVMSLCDNVEAFMVICQLWEMLKRENIAHFEIRKSF